MHRLAPLGLAVINGDSRYVHVDRALCDLLGYDDHELLGRHFSDVTHGNDLKLCFEHHRAFRARPDAPVRWECRLLHKEGRAIWTRQTLTAGLPRPDEPGTALCLVEDITDERGMEAERQRLGEQIRRSQRMEAVGRLAGGVAHEFNNRLSVILNNLDFADRHLHEPGEGAAPFLQAVRQAALQSASLVRKLMVFGRCDVVPPQVLDLSATLGALEPQIRRIAGDAIELALQPGDEPARAWLAPAHAEQLVANLVVNAREAMPRGGRLTVTVRSRILDEEAARSRPGVRPGRYAQIIVDDTGVGMSQETLARAFEPFFTTKPAGEGPGLGLSIVYGIVEEAGGHVLVESAPGAGTRFEILLPTADMLPRQEPTGDLLPVTHGRNERVLVVEDEPAVRDLTVLILREHGYDVWTVNGPEEALQKLMNEQTPLDLLLTDVIMPRLSGTDLAAYVKALRPSARVLFMSGRADEHVGRQRVRRREVAFLQKPFDADGLLRAVREALDTPAAEPAGSP